MSYCKKGSTTGLIGKMDEDEVWSFAHDVAAGLAYLHDYKAIVHQDIKPGNILVDDDGKFMITDFDISAKQQKTVRMTVKQAKEMQDYNYGSGTPDYMGPERWPDEGYIPPVKPICASDIWSLGATLFELMTGDVPFGETGGSYERKYHAIPKITGNYSKELKKLVRLCLAEEPWERPTAKDIAENALRHKAPKPPTTKDKKWVKYLSIGSMAAIMIPVIFFLSKNRGKSGDEWTREDSLFIAQVEEAAVIVSDAWKSEDKKDKASSAGTVAKIAEASSQYQSSLSIPVSHDSIRAYGEQIWMASQCLIDSTFLYFSSQESHYASLDEDDRPAAADSFALRINDLRPYISDHLK